MPKKTILDDSASIYQPRSEQTEREKLRSLPPKKKVAYLWEYYRKPAFAVLLVIAFLGYIIYELVTPNIKSQFDAAVIDNTIPADLWDTCEKDFADYLQINPKTESIDINPDFYLKAQDSYAMNMQTALTTRLFSGDIDVIIAPESTFKTYTTEELFDELSEQLPADLYSSLTDNFYYSSSKNNSDKNVIGIYLSDCELFQKNADNTDPYVLGIVGNSHHKKNTVEFLRFLFKCYP